MNLIEHELEMSKINMFDTVVHKGKELVQLTPRNVALVEAIIRNDSAYIKTSDVTAKPTTKRDGSISYFGSTAFWMKELQKVLIDGVKSEYEFGAIIQGAVEAVDRENSTHLNADGVGRKEIIARIESIDRDELIKCLQCPEHGNLKLLNEIARKTSAAVKARTNVSFASKFCHYACFNMFEGTAYQDNYSIYDGILKASLPLYLDYFGIDTKYNLNCYGEYRDAIDTIRLKLDKPISRNGFDHLIWYYHKGRMN